MTQRRKGLNSSHAHSKASFKLDPDRKRVASRAHSKASFTLDPEKKRVTSRSYSKASFILDPEKKRVASRTYSKALYKSTPEKKRVASRAYSKISFRLDPVKKRVASYIRRIVNRAKNFNVKHIAKEHSKRMTTTYKLTEPKYIVKNQYIKAMQDNLQTKNSPEAKNLHLS